MRARQQAVAAAGEMAGNADRRAAPGLQRQPLRGERLIKLKQRDAGAHRDQAGRLVDHNPVQAANVDRDVGGLRKPLIGMAAAPDGEIQFVAANPVDHDRDRMLGVAYRAQRRAQLLALVGGRQVIGVARSEGLRKARRWREGSATAAAAIAAAAGAASGAARLPRAVAAARKGEIRRRETDVPLNHSVRMSHAAGSAAHPHARFPERQATGIVRIDDRRMVRMVDMDVGHRLGRRLSEQPTSCDRRAPCRPTCRAVSLFTPTSNVPPMTT